MPVFNGEAYLADAIESALVQTFSDFELIIVDDCSTDESFTIIEKYAARDKRITYWCNTEKAGLFGNYNLCIDAATGQYIKLFAQDDLLHSDMLEKLVSVLDSDPDVALVSTARALIGHKGTRIKPKTPQASAADYFPASRSVAGREVVKRSINPVNNFVGEPTTVMFRSEYVGSGFDSTFYHLGDLEYWFRILLNGRYMFLDEELCSFRMHDGSTTTTNHKFLLYSADLLKLGRKYKRFIWEAGGTQSAFNDQVIKRVVGDVQARGDAFRSGLQSIEPDFLAEFGDYVSNESLHSMPAGLMELALQALMRVPTTEKTEDRRAILYGLERTLQTYLASASWSVTRPLREMNKSFMDIEEELETYYYQCDSDISYERFLRKMIWRIKHSRSWRITKPVRVVSRWIQTAFSDKIQIEAESLSVSNIEIEDSAPTPPSRLIQNISGH